MRRHRDLNYDSWLDTQPYALIVPSALETQCDQLLASIYDPAGNDQQTQNPFARRVELVVDPRLAAASSIAGYLVCNPEAIPWMKRIYLQVKTHPYIEEKAGWEINPLEIKCRHDFAPNAYMSQGAVYNAGA